MNKSTTYSVLLDSSKLGLLLFYKLCTYIYSKGPVFNEIPIANHKNWLQYWCYWLAHMFSQPNGAKAARTIEPNAWWELSLREERSHKIQEDVAASFWCLWCCYGSLYELGKKTKNLAPIFWKKKEKSLEAKKLSRTNNKKRANHFLMFPVSAMSSFNFIKEFKCLWEKSMKKIQMVSMSVFKNKANVPITITNCGVSSKIKSICIQI